MRGGRARLKSNNKRRSIGAEWSMPEIGIPPPHNLYNPHALVASINNKIYFILYPGQISREGFILHLSMFV